MKITLQKPDNIGVLASTLCMVHCLVTPFLFVVHTCTASCCEATPAWWQWIDYLFLIVSFFAVHRSVQTTSNNFMKPLLWISWSGLFFVIINENLIGYKIHELIKYIVASSLVLLHLYNQRYCQCKTDSCCTVTN